MKKIFVFLLIITVASVSFITVSATDSTEPVQTEINTEAATEVVSDVFPEESDTLQNNTYESDTTPTIDSEVVSDVIDVIENSENKAEAILAIVEMLGVSTEEAEHIINAIISVGDKYLGQSPAWIGFKNDIQENIEFWVIVFVCAAAIITIVGITFVFLGRVNPELRRSMFGTGDAIKICKDQASEVSQTLVNLKECVTNAAESAVKKDEELNRIIKEKEDYIEKLVKKISSIELEANKERRNMLLAEAYNLQILKLICSRTALPLADKATIDLWYNKAMESLKSDLSEEDIKKLEDIASMLEERHG